MTLLNIFMTKLKPNESFLKALGGKIAKRNAGRGNKAYRQGLIDSIAWLLAGGTVSDMECLIRKEVRY